MRHIVSSTYACLLGLVLLVAVPALGLVVYSSHATLGLALVSLSVLLAAWLAAVLFGARPAQAPAPPAHARGADGAGVRPDAPAPSPAGEPDRTLRAALAASPVAIVALDSERRVTLWSPAAERLFGWTAAEMMGGTQPTCVQRDGHGEILDPVERALDGECLVDVDVRRVRRDGQVLDLGFSAAPIHAPDGVVTGVVAVYVDTTARRVHDCRDQQTQTMEAVGRLAGGVAHDFNNILTVIQGFGELLHGRPDLDAAAKRDVQEMLSATRRASDLTRQLLAFGRRQPARPSVVGLNQVVVGMTRAIEQHVGEKIQVEVRANAERDRVNLDRSLLEQAITRLAANAREAMPEGGRLVIETENRTCPAVGAGRCDVASCPGSCVTLRMTDTGVGMDADTLRHAFEPFYSTKERCQGAGLGLSTVYGIVRQSGGDITVGSEPGRGTRFEVRLPLTEEAGAGGHAPAVASLPGAAAAAPRGAETVLVVEDEDLVRALVSATLQRSGYRVLAARHGQEALAVSERHAGEIHLLLTDVIMPGLDGPEVARRLSESRRGIKILYMSGYAGNRSGGEELTPAAPLLEKPFALDVLTRKVREVMDEAA